MGTFPSVSTLSAAASTEDPSIEQKLSLEPGPVSAGPQNPDIPCGISEKEPL